VRDAGAGADRADPLRDGAAPDERQPVAVILDEAWRGRVELRAAASAASVSALAAIAPARHAAVSAAGVTSSVGSNGPPISA